MMSAPMQITPPHHLRSNFLYVATRELIEGKLDIMLRRPYAKDAVCVVSTKDMDLPDDAYALEEMLNSAAAS
jgi:hypothetical protein